MALLTWSFNRDSDCFLTADGNFYVEKEWHTFPTDNISIHKPDNGWAASNITLNVVENKVEIPYFKGFVGSKTIADLADLYGSSAKEWDSGYMFGIGHNYNDRNWMEFLFEGDLYNQMITTDHPLPTNLNIENNYYNNGWNPSKYTDRIQPWYNYPKSPVMYGLASKGFGGSWCMTEGTIPTSTQNENISVSISPYLSVNYPQYGTATPLPLGDPLIISGCSNHSDHYPTGIIVVFGVTDYTESST